MNVWLLCEVGADKDKAMQDKLAIRGARRRVGSGAGPASQTSCTHVTDKPEFVKLGMRLISA